MKKIIITLISLLMATALLSACGDRQAFETDRELTVISREEGSGTRGAFVELFGIEEKNAAGVKIDRTWLGADVTNNTAVMMTSVASNTYAIGYLSLGSLNDSVKALSIDGAAPSVESIKNGGYTVSRPFNIVTKGAPQEAAADFIGYVKSAAAARVIEEAGYISVDTDGYTSSLPQGKLVIAGSSSVTPLMEKLKESYAVINPALTIEIQQSDSTTGVNSLLDGICQIGMASRELKESELAKGAVATVIALDGIAVIVNNDNPLEGLSREQVQKIFTGETRLWSELAE